tara:strand:+ start:655 stop:843 length:189 start_codon:yes stop_codon:yes gene_type:complete
MNINDFIKDYHSLISCPLVINNTFGFELVGGLKWFFNDSTLSDSSKKALQKLYKKLNLTHTV